MLDDAIQHHQAGRLAEAEALYRQIVSHDPANAAAWNLLGVLADQLNHGDVAINLISRAISLEPNNAGHYCNLGNVLLRIGRIDEAIDAYRRAIALHPRYAGAIYNLANAWMAQKKFEEAATGYRAVIELNPQAVEAHGNLALTLQMLGRHVEAERSYRRAIELRPDFTAAWNNLGNALKKQGRFDEAIAAFRRAIQIDPRFAEAYNNLGNSLRDQFQLDDAMIAYDTALANNPDFADAHNNRANMLRVSGRTDEAIAEFRRAIELKPDLIDAINNLGNAYCDQARLADAIACYDHTMTLDPTYRNGHSNRIYTMHFDERFSAGEILEEAKRWEQRHAKKFTALPHVFTNDRARDRKLKIGYVSPDFRDHVVGRNLIPLFREHDRERFEIFCYASQIWHDPMTSWFKGNAGQWRDIGVLDDDQAAEMIRADGIDILVDLALHMGNNRLLLLARKPAPIQVTFAGYPGGTGLSTIDYRLTDPYLDPPENDSHYVERSIRLPHSFWCYDPLGLEVAVNELPAKTNGYVTFGCLNNLCKVTPAALDAWSRVLRAKPGARMILLTNEGSHRQRTRDQFQQRGVDPHRIEFADRETPINYLHHYHRIDLGLDSFPYNGHTTSLDSLWMGVPVITLVGQTAVARAGWSQLNNLGLQELAATDDDAFARIALDWSSDLDRLGKLRATLRSRMEKSPLMDAKQFARGIENAYRRMWENYVS